MNSILIQALQIYSYILLARILMSWVPQLRNNQIGQILYQLTEPVMAPFRKILPPMGGMDFSPILLFMGINYLIRLLA